MKQKILKYNPHLIPLARKLRNNLTHSEAILWSKLSNRQLLGYKFTRQKPISNYIVDFYCRELSLVIEIDGFSHDEKTFESDKYREEQLSRLGLKILRFTEFQVKSNVNDVLETIVVYIKETHPSSI